MTINYEAVVRDLRQRLGDSAVTDDPVRRFAWSTDASYFRIVPQVVVHVEYADQVKVVLEIANRYKAPITFRAAGTSISGQAIGEGILVRLGFDGFRELEINEDASLVKLGVAIIGGEANTALKPFNKKIGPDPGSVNICMVGGIINNNSSGMCCGTAQNSYQTIHSMRIMLLDGTELDTGSSLSRAQFKRSHSHLLDALSDLAQMAKANTALAERIRHKYKIKNTTGYSLNALIDFDDPFDILQHVIIGSEGTLAFVKNVTYHTVEESPHKATALAVFYDLEVGASTIPMLKEEGVSAAELLDWTTVKTIIGAPGMPAWLEELPEGTAMMLVECRAPNPTELEQKTADIAAKLSEYRTIRPIEFSSDPAVYNQYWLLRQSLYPIVGGRRPKGTTIITEDLAVRQEDLAAAVKDLAALLIKHNYPEGIIFGHALAGNLHFIITPHMSTEADIKQYEAFMDDVVKITVEKYDGSLKAEHGTGRAVAPFVEYEWGHEAYTLMKTLKSIFDPENLLNPGVLLNDDKAIHIKNIKPITNVDDLVDRCIECGFCEKTCPTTALNLTPRQRISTLREINRLEQNGESEAAAKMKAAAKYDVIDSCTACQLCTIACPVDNSMGELVRKLRSPYITSTQQKVLDFQAQHWGKVNSSISAGFDLLNLVRKTAGNKATDLLMKGARKLSAEVPVWNPDFPQGGGLPSPQESSIYKPSVVYFAACGGRTFCATPQDPNQTTLADTVVTLLERAGYNVIVPDNTRQLCCGQMWESKGDFKNADYKRNELIDTLAQLTHNGEYPVVIDALSCTASALKQAAQFKLMDLTDFLHDEVLAKLDLHKKENIALHLGCSARKLGIEAKLEHIAHACATTVTLPAGITCCGYAGEKGLYQPEINATALRNLKANLPKAVHEGYYANRMCEVGLSHHSGISYRHIAFLMEECSR